MDKKSIIACLIIFTNVLIVSCFMALRSEKRIAQSEHTVTTSVTTADTTVTSLATTTSTTTTTKKKTTTKKETATTEPEPTANPVTEKITTTIPIETTIQETEVETSWEISAYNCDYSPYDLQAMGVINWGGYRYTYYSELVLPGYGLQIEGRHVDGDGFVCDGDGYICVASGSLNWGTVVDTPFGRQGKVYDSGCAADVIDCYVHW